MKLPGISWRLKISTQYLMILQYCEPRIRDSQRLYNQTNLIKAQKFTSKTGWWFGTFFIFPYIGNNHPNWLSYFSEELKPPTRWWSILVTAVIWKPRRYLRRRLHQRWAFHGGVHFGEPVVIHFWDFPWIQPSSYGGSPFMEPPPCKLWSINHDHVYGWSMDHLWIWLIYPTWEWMLT